MDNYTTFNKNASSQNVKTLYTAVYYYKSMRRQVFYLTNLLKVPRIPPKYDRQ